MTADIQTVEILVPGLQGPGGAIGPVPSHAWFNTSLAFQQPDGTMGDAVNLRGPAPAHQWTGTSIAFQQPNGTWGVAVDLHGDPGPKGDRGEKGGDGKEGPRGFRGDRGETGPPPELVVGQVNHLAPDQSPTMTLDPVAPGRYALAFGVPQGLQGERGLRGFVGPAPKLVVGPVTTLPFTQPAAARIKASQTAGQYDVEFDIPGGPPGDQAPVGNIEPGNVVVFFDVNGRLADGGKLAPLAFSASWNDLTNKPGAFPPVAHTHALADITNAGALAGKSTVSDADWSGADLSIANGGTGASTAPAARAALGLGNVDNTADADKPVSTATATALGGKADLIGGKVPESQIPAVAITDVFEVASQAAMLALDAQRGDVAVRSDINRSFILRAAPAATLANWTELRTPTDAVLSVAGKTGAVALVIGDIDGLAAALAGKADAASLGALAGKSSVNNADWNGADLTIANGGTGASDAATARANLGALAKSGDTLTGALSTTPGALAVLTGGTTAVDYATSNRRQFELRSGANTFNVTGIPVSGGDLQLDFLYTAGSLAFTQTIRWKIGGGQESTNLADTGVTLTAGTRYTVVLWNMGGTIYGVIG